MHMCLSAYDNIFGQSIRLECNRLFLYLSVFLFMICGRYFSEDFGGDLNRIVLNEEAVRLLGYESPEAALGPVSYTHLDKKNTCRR